MSLINPHYCGDCCAWYENSPCPCEDADGAGRYVTPAEMIEWCQYLLDRGRAIEGKQRKPLRRLDTDNTDAE